MLKFLHNMVNAVGATRVRRYGFSFVVALIGLAVSFLVTKALLPTILLFGALAVMSTWFAGARAGWLTALLCFAGWVALGGSAAAISLPLLLSVSCFCAAVFVVARLQRSWLKNYQQQAMLPLPLWEQDADFNRLMQSMPFTLVDPARCHILYQAARLSAIVSGDVAEIGVYRGGTAKLLAKVLTGKTVHLFDTFDGMPTTKTGVDLHRKGDFADTSLEVVRGQLQDCANVRFYQGFFPQTARPIEATRFAMVHVDADIYDSVKACCDFFYPRLEKGGVMVFDDYGFPSCPGARKAVDEFFAAKPETPMYLPTGQCILIRN